MRNRAAAIVLVIAMSLTVGACGGSCPAALLTGTLVERSGELAVTPDGGLPTERVDWAASGYGVARAGDVLAVTEGLGTTKARAGDRVRLGGGESTPGVWRICGLFEAQAASPG